MPYAQAEAEFERQTLECALAASNGQISEAARMLRISRATFYNTCQIRIGAIGLLARLIFETQIRLKSRTVDTAVPRGVSSAAAAELPIFRSF